MKLVGGGGMQWVWKSHSPQFLTLKNPSKNTRTQSKIFIGGESSGGCHTALCSMELAKHNEAGLVKFAWMDIAAVSDHWCVRTMLVSVRWRGLEGFKADNSVI